MSPQARSIENCWAKKKQQLTRPIEFKMKEFDTNFVENLLEGVMAKVRFIGDNGVYA